MQLDAGVRLAKIIEERSSQPSARAMAGLNTRPSALPLDESVLTEPLLGYLVFELSLHVDLRVQVLQRLGSELLGDGLEQLRDLGIFFHHVLAHVECRVVDGEEALVVLDELEI